MPDHKELHTIKYMQIAREIEEEIRKFRIHPGSPVYSVRDIIRRWNVSSESAQNVLKFLEQRDIIFRVPRKGCFVKARGKKRESRNFKVGCCIYDMATDFKLDHLIKLPELELVDILEKNHCTLKYLDKMIFHDPASVHRELNGLDGLIVSAVPVKLTECKALADLKIPAVAIHGDILFDFPFHQVLPDPMTGLRAMFQEAKKFHVDHVITVTHNHPNGLTRAAACRKAAEECGIRNISSVVLNPDRRGEYNMAMELASSLRNTLVFTCSCTIAFPFLNAFSDTKKLSPSRDYHLVCYDDIESIGIMPKPAPVMTTIGYSHEKLIQNAAKILLDEMNEPGGCIKKILIPTSLTIRGSGLCDTDAEQNRGKQKKF